LLLDCGIGTTAASSSSNEDSATSQHRVLIFCQLKQMLDIVEHDLLRTLMPTVTYMRMDGSTEPSKRHAVVQTFNADPTIDCLLLTTHVGGLGLNLTSADTVIFVEHDWNPMKDLQAMDRAHRLGQKKVVNVYRLIMRGTLEEKIMGFVSFARAFATGSYSSRDAVFNASSSVSRHLSSRSRTPIFRRWAPMASSISSTSRHPTKRRPRNLRTGLSVRRRSWKAWTIFRQKTSVSSSRTGRYR
jgi:hypothetical protein